MFGRRWGMHGWAGFVVSGKATMRGLVIIVRNALVTATSPLHCTFLHQANLVTRYSFDAGLPMTSVMLL